MATQQAPEQLKSRCCKGIWGVVFCAFGILQLLLSFVKSSSERMADSSHCLIFGPIKIAYISHIDFNFLFICGGHAELRGQLLGTRSLLPP